MTRAGPLAALVTARNVLLAANDPTVWPVAAAIDTWLASGGCFAQALDLAPDWHEARRQRQRHAALQELAARHFVPLRGRARARAIVKAGTTYATSRWERDRKQGHRPDGMEGLFYDVLRTGPIPTEETLRKCIG